MKLHRPHAALRRFLPRSLIVPPALEIIWNPQHSSQINLPWWRSHTRPLRLAVGVSDFENQLILQPCWKHVGAAFSGSSALLRWDQWSLSNHDQYLQLAVTHCCCITQHSATEHIELCGFRLNRRERKSHTPGSCPFGFQKRVTGCFQGGIMT